MAALTRYVDGLSEHIVKSSDDVVALLRAGQRARATAATTMNQASSRSHAVFTMVVERSVPAEVGCVTAGFVINSYTFLLLNLPLPVSREVGLCDRWFCHHFVYSLAFLPLSEVCFFIGKTPGCRVIDYD